MLFWATLIPMIIFGPWLRYSSTIVALAMFPLFLLSSLQFDVGTDYYSYLDRALVGDASTFTRQGEFLFAVFVWVSAYLGNPQSLFFITSFVQIFGWFLFGRMFLLRFRIYSTTNLAFFLFLILFVGNAAANQLNLLRFFSGAPFFLLLLLSMDKARYKLSWVFLIIICSSLHISFLPLSLVALFFTLFRVTYPLVLFMSCSCLVTIEVILLFLVDFYTPAARLAGSFSFSPGMSLTKIPYLISWVLIFAGLRRRSEYFTTYAMLIFFIPLVLILPVGISDRIWHLVAIISPALLFVVAVDGHERLFAQASRVYIFVWFLLPALKYLVFAEREYLYRWIL
jgi:hypothetical protein